MSALPGWLLPVTAAAVLLVLAISLIMQLRRFVSVHAEAFRVSGEYPERGGYPERPIPLGPAVWTTAVFVLLASGVLGFFLGMATRQAWNAVDVLTVAARLALALFFATLTIVLFQFFVRTSRQERRSPRIESHWGGLGGGLGGWTVSWSLLYLVAAIFFGALTALTANVSSSRTSAPQTTQTTQADKPQGK